MVVKIADNIFSPLGDSTVANLQQVRHGESSLMQHSFDGMPQPFVASMMPSRLSFAQIALQSLSRALAQVPDLDVSSPRVLLVVSSTKGDTVSAPSVSLPQSALWLASQVGITSRPVVVSNACISGLAAQIFALRMLQSRSYDVAIVVGADVLSHFIVAGFQSFRALSADPCRPFDADRCGLNLGEAAATVIFQYSDFPEPHQWCISRGAIRNDACHISAPSKSAAGASSALSAVADGVPHHSLACISAHGTATLYNDDMESRAIAQAGLADDVLVSGLKGYYGHTLGAAGLLESLLTMAAIDDGWVPATRGFDEGGTIRDLKVCNVHQPTQARSFIKMMSGFGGANAAALFSKGGVL